MDPDEVEFLAETCTVRIVPKFNSTTIHLIAGDIGPFRAAIETNVPLWVAIHLKREQRCSIIAPAWMQLDRLEEIKEHEKKSNQFTRMPSKHYMVEAKLILGHAAEDISQADEIKTCVKDIWDIRMSKLRTLVDQLIVTEKWPTCLFDNLTVLELNTVRPLVPQSLNCLDRFKNDTSGDSAPSADHETSLFDTTSGSFQPHRSVMTAVSSHYNTTGDNNTTANITNTTTTPSVAPNTVRNDSNNDSYSILS